MKQVLKGVANDLPGTGSNLPTGVFVDSVVANLSKKIDTIPNAIEACHYLHRPTFIAVDTGIAWIRRSHLLFFLTTVVTGNLIYHFIVLPFVYQGYDLGWSPLARFLGAIVFPAVGAGVAIGLDGATAGIIYYIVIPPILLMIWYEFLLPKLTREPFIHPYVFALVLSLLTVIALGENGVLDYDIITGEIWKSHLVSCLYFGICWFYLFMEGDEDPKKSRYIQKPVQETIYLSMVLSAIVLANTALAPYPTYDSLNILWALPALFALLAYLSVIWVSEIDRFSDMYTSGTNREAQRRRWVEGHITEKSPWHQENGYLVTSTALLFLTFLATTYFWREYSMVTQAMWEIIPTNTVQISKTAKWLLPNYL